MEFAEQSQFVEVLAFRIDIFAEEFLVKVKESDSQNQFHCRHATEWLDIKQYVKQQFKGCPDNWNVYKKGKLLGGGGCFINEIIRIGDFESGQ